MRSDPDQEYVQHHLKSIIIHSLDNLNYKNAEFACERLLASDPSNLESIYLYTLTLFRQGRFKSVYNKLAEIIEINDNLGCGYIFAKLCFQLKKYKEGIYQLLKISHLYNESAIIPFMNENNDKFFNSNDTNVNNNLKNGNPAFFTTAQARYTYLSQRSIYPDLSSIYHLLGDLYKATGDIKSSALNYSYCLTYNQFDFEALQEICKMGVYVKVKSIFKPNSMFKDAPLSTVTNLPNKSRPSFLDPNTTDKSIDYSNTNPNNISNPFSTTPVNNGNKPMAVDELEFVSTPRVKVTLVPDAPIRKPTTDNGGSNNRFDFPKPSFPMHSNTIITPTGNDNSRKSKRESTYSKITSRLISQPNKSNDNNANVNAHNNSNNNGGVGAVTNPNNLNKRPAGIRNGLKRNSSSGLIPTSSNLNEAHHNHHNQLSIMTNKEIINSDAYLLKLYSIFAKGIKSMCKYDCYKAIRILESLPDNEKETPWVLSKLGRLHYEIVNYKQSEHLFVKLRTLDRTRLEDMEYYSTLLWHLHKKVELTYLANELHDLDKDLAVTWCVIGNLFSLTREPHEAIKCFSKSIKLNENFTYAYTLKGHEYLGNDNYEMALENFRIGLLIDPRHYNALYGIGMVYINLGDYQKADYHFRKAVSINPVNITLICCVGMVLEKLGKKSLALRQYELANKLQPLNALPIFKKAQLLFSMQQFSQALKYFEQVKELAPNEASVHFLLGQLYNIQDDKFQAIREFTIALNLDPKGNYLIREAMESLKQRS